MSSRTALYRLLPRDLLWAKGRPLELVRRKVEPLRRKVPDSETQWSYSNEKSPPMR
jgi:hypothetical protein